MSNIKIYTDGSSRGNPGNGGIGAILISGSHTKEISQGFRYTTNNRMEIMAVILALECLKKAGNNVEIYSDSKYVVDAFNKNWISSWKNRDFKNVKNKDLWDRLIDLCDKNNVTFNWVKGHSTNEYNNRCDILATTAAKSNDFIDCGYRNQK